MSGASQAFLGHQAHRGSATVPAYRASSNATAASATSLGVVIPSGAQIGDMALFVFNCDPNPTSPSTPSGLTLMAAKVNAAAYTTTGNTCAVWLYKKVLVSGDPGATVTFTIGAATPIIINCVVYSGVSDIGIGPDMARNDNPGLAGVEAPRIPEIYPGAKDLVVIFGGTKCFTSLNVADAKISTVPSGFTIRQNNSNQISFLTLAFGAWIADGPASKLQTLAPANQGQSYNVAGVLTLSPAGRRPTHKLPASLRDVALHGYGTSYFAWIAPASHPPWGHLAEDTMYDRVMTAMCSSFLSLPEQNNLALPGSWSADICGFAYGTVVYTTRVLNGEANWSVSQAGTWTGFTNRSGLVLMELLGNDALHDLTTSSTKSRSGCQVAVDALVRLVRSSSFVGHGDSSVVKTGTWASTSANDYGGGSISSTSTNADKVTITTTATSIDVVLSALDDSAFGSTGSTFTVKVDGVQVASDTTSNKMLKPGSAGTYNASAYCPMCVPCYNMGAGTHTIVVTHTGTTGNKLYFNGYLVQSGTPPIILLHKLAHYSSTYFTNAGNVSSNAILDIYSGFADTIAAQFPDGRVITADPLGSGEWDIATMVTTQDNLHQLDTGTGFQAHEIIRALQEKVA